jgi:hypothetical protein
LSSSYKAHGLTAGEFLGTKYMRIKHIKKLQDIGQLNTTLRWKNSAQQNVSVA